MVAKIQRKKVIMGPYCGPFKNALESPRPSPKYPMKNKAAEHVAELCLEHCKRDCYCIISLEQSLFGITSSTLRYPFPLSKYYSVVDIFFLEQ
jgi:hypothetical protein